MIYITGDMHGDQSRLLYSKEEKLWGKGDIIIVAGDWGFLFHDNYSENMFLNDIEQRPYTLAFVDGNHENFVALNKYPVEIWNGGKVHRIRNNIFHLMRGQIFTIEGKKFFTFGGAYSLDRYRRRLNIEYWEEEIPSRADYNEATVNLKAHNFEVDYIITHQAPRKIIMMMGETPDLHDMELTGFLDYVLYDIKHTHWFCGHWHLDKDITESFTILRNKYRKL